MSKNTVSTPNNKAEEIKKAINAKEKEITAITEEKKVVANDAEKIVLAEKKELRARSELEALQAAHRAATYTPPAPTDQQELLAGLKKYQDIWDDRIKVIKDKISDVDKEAAQLEISMEQATQNADAESVIKLSNRRNELTSQRKHLTDMLRRAEEIPLYPDGAIKSEWDNICNKLRPEWDNKIMELKALAKAYKSAADSLIQMNETIKTVRNDLERKQGGAHFSKFFTVGESGEDMIVEKSYIPRITGIFDSLFSPHDTL